MLQGKFKSRQIFEKKLTLEQLTRSRKALAFDRVPMDSTVLHWVIRVQELNVRRCAETFKLSIITQTALHTVQGVVQNRNAELQSQHLRLTEVHRDLQHNLEQQV